MRSIAQKLLRRFTASRPLRWMRSTFADQRGNVLILTALTMPALLAMSGLAFEGASWYQAKRAMQNAADTAAVAAATNNGASYISEARAVTAQYGFQNGADNTTVTVSNTVTCPVSGSTCYSVSITKSLPLYFTKLIGYSGNVTISGSPGQQIASIAVAVEGTSPREYCILALATSGDTQALRTNGAPKADLTGCSVMSNSDAQCNGHDLKATYGDAHGTSSGCGGKQTSGVPTVSDSYSGLASNIPFNTCTSYPQAPSKHKDPDLPSSNELSGSYNWSGNVQLCGDIQLTGNVTLTGSNAVVVIRNGRLDTNGYTIKTASGASATIVFSGDNTSGYTHAPTGKGTIDIAAPTTGNWKGVALYQDPGLTNGVDISEAGNSPTWNITGLVYLPHASVTFSGAVNKSSNGLSCFAMVVDNITINGTGSILSQGQCASAGLTLPTGQISSRGRLVS
jgi:Flp pilus assembly protein TadG